MEHRRMRGPGRAGARRRGIWSLWWWGLKPRGRGLELVEPIKRKGVGTTYGGSDSGCGRGCRDGRWGREVEAGAGGGDGGGGEDGDVVWNYVIAFVELERYGIAVGKLRAVAFGFISRRESRRIARCEDSGCSKPRSESCSLERVD